LGLNRAERRRREREERKKEKASGAASPVGHAVELTGEIIDHKCHAPVTLSDPFAKGPQAGLTIEALIDTGATHSCIEERVVKKLGLRTIGHLKMQVADGGVQERPVVAVTVGFTASDGQLISRKIQAAVVPHTAGYVMLFGMDPLMGGILTVDGTKGTWKWCIPWQLVK